MFVSVDLTNHRCKVSTFFKRIAYVNLTKHYYRGEGTEGKLASISHLAKGL